MYLVLNSIEFWSGSNPTASIGEVKTVQGENGEYLVKTNENGYTITKKGEDKSVDLVYNKENNTWNDCFWRTELRTCENERRRDSYFEPAKRNPP